MNSSFFPSFARISASRLPAVIFACAAMFLAGLWFAPQAAVGQGGLERLEAITATGTHVFNVEVMRTARQRQKGLMYRRFLAADRGMLFDFGEVAPVTMWMRNTYIPLDMVFLGADGKVVGLAENTEPLSERIIPSGAPALGVLELNAGTAARIGLKPGDRVRHTMFK